jgi:hypothetical protein
VGTLLTGSLAAAALFLRAELPTAIHSSGGAKTAQGAAMPRKTCSPRGISATVVSAATAPEIRTDLVGRNASDTKPAKFLAVLVKEKGAPIFTPVELP